MSKSANQQNVISHPTPDLNFRYEWRLDFMNTNQYTQKTLEALQAAQQLAVEYQHNALEPEHLLHALATQDRALSPSCSRN